MIHLINDNTSVLREDEIGFQLEDDRKKQMHRWASNNNRGEWNE